jgi:hypothetical protein
MTSIFIPKELTQKTQQAEWVQYGYDWARRDALADLGRDIKAIVDSHTSLFEAIRELQRKYLSLNDKGGQK